MLALANKYITAYRLTVLIAIVLLFVGIGVVINFLWNTPTIPVASSSYETPVITTNTKPLCPGDKVVYDEIAHFKVASAYRVASTVWSIDRNITAIADKAPSYINYFEPTTVKLHGEWVIPADLPPGRYYRITSTTAEGRQSEMFRVVFTVKAGC